MATSRRNPQSLDKGPLSVDDVANRDERKPHAVGATGQGIVGARASAPLATAKNVGADHESAIGVDGPARTDKRRPPAARPSR